MDPVEHQLLAMEEALALFLFICQLCVDVSPYQLLELHVITGDPLVDGVKRQGVVIDGVIDTRYVGLYVRDLLVEL